MGNNLLFKIADQQDNSRRGTKPWSRGKQVPKLYIYPATTYLSNFIEADNYTNDLSEITMAIIAITYPKLG